MRAHLSEQVAQDATVQPQEQGQPLHGRHLLGEPFPLVMQVPDMLRAFGIKKSTFYARMKRGAYSRFELPGLGRRAWSGLKVQRHLLNTDERFFGRKAR